MQSRNKVKELIRAPATYKTEIEIINKNTGGDVTKNETLMSYIPKTSLSEKIVLSARYGTPMIKFGDGTGFTAMILAGIHGNELPPQIAAMKLVNDMQIEEIKGIVYIIPFLAPSATEKNVRFWNGIDLNRVANIPGTPTNMVLNFTEQKKIEYVGDFHSTRPGGYPGKRCVLCSSMPTYESFKMADYIEKRTRSFLLSFATAGSEFPGALGDILNLRGIPTVTGEVLSPHGIVRPGSVISSYKQMEAFLKYCGTLKVSPDIT